MKTCRICGSHGINMHLHGRDGVSDPDLCDVCYWHKRADVLSTTIQALRGIVTHDSETKADFIARVRDILDRGTP